MQSIVANGVKVEVIRITSEITRYNGAIVEALKVYFPSDATQEQIDALISAPWEIYDSEGNIQGTQEGVTHVSDYSITFLKVPDAVTLQAKVDALTVETETLRTAKTALEKQISEINIAALPEKEISL